MLSNKEYLLESGWRLTKLENPNFKCSMCGSNEIVYDLVESSCGSYDDYHYKCEFGRDWWVESADY